MTVTEQPVVQTGETSVNVDDSCQGNMFGVRSASLQAPYEVSH